MPAFRRRAERAATAAKFVTGADVKNGSLTGKDIKNGSVGAAEIRKGSIGESRLADGLRAQLGTTVSGSPGTAGQKGEKGNKGAWLTSTRSGSTCSRPARTGPLRRRTCRRSRSRSTRTWGRPRATSRRWCSCRPRTRRRMSGATTSTPRRPASGVSRVPPARPRAAPLSAGLCDFDDIKAALPDATIFTAAVTKGRDFSWQGAVDGLTINDDVFDFEESGVSTR